MGDNSPKFNNLGVESESEYRNTCMGLSHNNLDASYVNSCNQLQEVVSPSIGERSVDSDTCIVHIGEDSGNLVGQDVSRDDPCQHECYSHNLYENDAAIFRDDNFSDYNFCQAANVDMFGLPGNGCLWFENVECNSNPAWYTGAAAPSSYVYPDFLINFIFDKETPLETDVFDLKLHDTIFLSGRPNYSYCRKSLLTDLNISLFRQYLGDYHDPKVVDFLEFGWPINYVKDSLPNPPARPAAMTYATDIDNYISKEIENGHICGPFDSNPFRIKPSIAPLFTVPKKEGGRRVIVDCSYGGYYSVNDGIPIDTFLGVESQLHYPRHEQFIELLLKSGKNCKIWKCDLSKAFRQFPVDPHDYAFQCFRWKEKIYVDKRLMFGMRSSPQACQRTTNYVNFILNLNGISCINYVDDFGGVSQAFNAFHDYTQTLQLFKDLGLKVSGDKCCAPSNIMTFLGKEYNTTTMTVKIPDDKRCEIIDCLHQFEKKSKCTKRQLQQVIGKLAFAADCVRSGRLFIARMLCVLRKYKYNHYRIYLNIEFKKDIKWWIEFFKQFNGISYIPDVLWQQPDTFFSTDACLKGIGGVNFVNQEYFHIDIPSKFSGAHIGVYEIYAVYVALRLWEKHITNKRIKIYCDNQSVIQVVNSGRGRDEVMLHFARQIAMICAFNNAEIRLVYIESKSNELSDCLSRWNLEPKYRGRFEQLISMCDGSFTECTVSKCMLQDYYDI